jgi:hypothetical protein
MHKRATRYYLRRQIEAIRGKPNKKPTVRQDRNTTAGERELERALDNAIQKDTKGEEATK